MALIPSYETTHVIDGYIEADLFNETFAQTTITEGWFKDPSLESAQLIEREVVTRNQFDTVLERRIERWSYERPGGPPQQYNREVWSKAYVPEVNPNRYLKLMEEEIVVFWTFAPFSKDALSFRREVNAWVLYDLKPTEDLDADAQAALEDRGQKSDGATDFEKRFHVASARLWSEAIERGSIVEKVDANQTARWVTGVITEETSVSEEPDRYTRWTTRKWALRPDQVEVSGPDYIQKEDYTYTLGVDVRPPTCSASETSDRGVRIQANGGGARLSFPLQTGPKRYDRKPDRYRFFRMKVDEAPREPDGDPFDLWDDEHSPVRRQSVLGNIWVKDYDGADVPNEGLPPLTSHSEPHDPTPVIPEGWRHVADVDNQAENVDYDDGWAVAYDSDVKGGATYAYAAVAVVQNSESPLSREARVTVSEDGSTRRGSIVVVEREDGTLEGDYEVPDDPQLQPMDEFGEVAEFVVPAMVVNDDWQGVPLDTVTLTSAATVSTTAKTFSTTPRGNPDVWVPGMTVEVRDVVGPPDPRYQNGTRQWRIYGSLSSSSDTQVSLSGIPADDHTYPIGSEVSVLGESFDPRIGLETGDEFDGTMEALVLAIGVRQGLRNLTSSYTITVDVEQPLLAIHPGMHVKLHGVQWDAFGNDRWMRSVIKDETWVLKGFSVKVARGGDGKMEHTRTRLVLEQR